MSDQWLVLNHHGWPVSAGEKELVLQRVVELNNALSPWERAAGYYYRFASVPKIVGGKLTNQVVKT